MRVWPRAPSHGYVAAGPHTKLALHARPSREVRAAIAAAPRLSQEEEAGRRAGVFAEIDEERIRQRGTWKGRMHEIQHNSDAVVHLMTGFLGTAQKALEHKDMGEYRFLMLQAATLAVAAIEILEPPSPITKREEGGTG